VYTIGCTNVLHNRMYQCTQPTVATYRFQCTRTNVPVYTTECTSVHNRITPPYKPWPPPCATACTTTVGVCATACPRVRRQSAVVGSVPTVRRAAGGMPCQREAKCVVLADPVGDEPQTSVGVDKTILKTTKSVFVPGLSFCLRRKVNFERFPSVPNWGLRDLSSFRSETSWSATCFEFPV
jgi:hypothetical protein